MLCTITIFSSLFLKFHQPTCEVFASWKWLCLVTCSSRSPAHQTQVGTNSSWHKMQIELAQLSTIPPVNMDWIVLLEYVTPRDEVHSKYFHRCKLLTIPGLPVKLNSAQLCRKAGSLCLGQIMIQRWMFTYAVTVSQAVIPVITISTLVQNLHYSWCLKKHWLAY